MSTTDFFMVLRVGNNVHGNIGLNGSNMNVMTGSGSLDLAIHSTTYRHHNVGLTLRMVLRVETKVLYGTFLGSAELAEV